MKKIKKIDSKVIHSNPRFDVIKHVYESEGERFPYYVFSENNGFVVVLGLDKDKIMMTKQYRVPVKKFSYEFVGGYIEDNEKPEDAAKREFLEETGYDCKKLEKIGELKAGVNKSDTTGHVFIARGFEKKQKNLDKFEKVVGLDSTWVSIDKVTWAIRKGLIFDSTTLAAWSIYNSSV